MKYLLICILLTIYVTYASAYCTWNGLRWGNGAKLPFVTPHVCAQVVCKDNKIQVHGCEHVSKPKDLSKCVYIHRDDDWRGSFPDCCDSFICRE